MAVFDGTISKGADEATSVFIINDIALTVPPTNISIRKEDMVWQWKTLRTNASTKIPSGRGIVQVSVRLIFVPQHFLEMHRLITQFKHSPFCYIENALIRDSIVPDWLNSQMMAFTMTGLNVQNMTGSPGTFIVDLDLRWFNYAPYAVNWLYRDEYATKPVGPEGIVRSIATYGPSLAKQQTIVDARPKDDQNLDSYEVISGTKDIVGGYTMDDLLFNHAGTAFDLLPRPTDVMRKAKPVTPQFSNIYKRYINILQQKSLFQNFEVDVAKLVRDQEPATAREFLSQEERSTLVFWDYFTAGRVVNQTSGGNYNRVEPLHGPMLPQSIRQEIIGKCLSYCKEARFYWHQYIVHENEPELRKALGEKVRDSHKAFAEEHIARARFLDDLRASMGSGSKGSNYNAILNTKSVAESIDDVEHARASGIPTSERLTYGDQNDIKKKLLALLPSKMESDAIDNPPSSEPQAPYLFSPVLETVDNFSGFGLREYPKGTKIRAHAGVDLVSSSKEVYAPFSGTLVIRSLSPYNTLVDTKEGYNYVTSNHDSTDMVNGNSRKSYLIAKGFVEPTGGIAVSIQSDDYPGYTAEFHHLRMIGDWGKISDTQMVRFYKDRKDVNNFGRIEKIVESVKVERGQLIGQYSDTGNSGNPHLHFELKKDGVAYDPMPFMIARDVSGLDETDLFLLGLTEQGMPDETSWADKQDAAECVPYEGDADEVYDPYTTSDVTLEEPVKESEEKTIALSKEQKDRWEAVERSYLEAGFIPYEDMQDVSNVRKRTVQYTFASENNDPLAGMLGKHYIRQIEDPDDTTHVFALKSSDNMVITNVVGSLTHVVASIPILGHEFPTHQHLGSVEPSYTIEFVTQADTLFNDNLSGEGALLELMRATLQRNARDFRPIPDSYSAVTDHFITRLLGSYEEEDVAFYASNGDPTSMESLKKRTLINRVSTQTVDGHPGLSSIQISLVETNPYETEELVVESNSNEDEREELIQEVLHRLYNLNLTPEGKVQKIVDEYATNIYTEEDDIAAKLEAAGLSPEDFGKTTWDEIKEVAVLTSTDEYQYSRLGTLGEDYRNIDPSPFTEESTMGEETAWKVLRDLQEAAAGVDIALYGKYHKEIKTLTDAATAFPSRESSATTTDFFVDMTDFYTVYPELRPKGDGGINANQLDIKAKHQFLKELIRSASLSIAESDFGVSSSAVSETFYNLPVQQEMVSCFIYFLDKYLHDLQENYSWDSDSSDMSQAVNVQRADVDNLLSLINWNFNFVEPSPENKALIDENYTELFENANSVGSAFIDFTGDVLTDMPGEDTGADKDRAELIEDFRNAVEEFGRAYINMFMKLSVDKEDIGIVSELMQGAEEWLTAAETWITGREGEIKQVTAYDTAAAQINYLCQWFFSPDVLGRVDSTAIVAIKTIKGMMQGVWLVNGIIGIIALVLMVAAVIFPDPGAAEGTVALGYAGARSLVSHVAYGSLRALGAMVHSTRAITTTVATSKGTALASGVAGGAYALSSAVDGESGVSVADENTAAYQFFIDGSARPDYESFITPDIEAQKLGFFRKKLIRLAESIISNPALLAALGIRTENYTLAPMLNEWVGKECYPDLDLPEHPYYVGTHSYAMSPDFYMWSPYEDGTAAIKDSIKEIVEKGVKTVVDNSYSFMKQMQQDGIKAVKDGGMQLNNSMGDVTPKILSLGMSPEGADEVKLMNRGTVIKERKSLLAPLELENKEVGEVYKMQKISVSAFSMDKKLEAEAWKALTGIAEEEVEDIDLSIGATDTLYLAEDADPTDGSAWDIATAGGKPVIAFSSSDFNAQYIDTTTSPEVYDQYFSKVKDITEMFGSRQGYTGDVLTEENAAEIVKQVADTAIASLAETENWYTKGGIEQVVKHSSADILSEKMTLKRAYPTFKLYFVEEDEQESRWLNLDDFYSFNAVKEFNFYQSRKEASSTATIVLQNIAGTLDGTRRNAIVDLDYFSRKEAGEIEEEKDVEVLADNKQHVASKDQPFDAIVLRPGMNVQLRVGYSNDPNMLHVLLNGRVVDVQWNMTGDLTEITVQSFGTELTQTRKGTAGNDYSVNWHDKVYYTTHQLLGSMMMDRDLKHFGRWEFGRLTQIGEDNNADLDFYPYEDEGFLGGMPMAEWTFDLFTSHPWKIGMFVLGLGAFALTRGRFGAALGTTRFAAGNAVSRTLQKFPLARGIANLTGRRFTVDALTASIRGIGTAPSSNAIWKALGKTGKELDEAVKALKLPSGGPLINSVNQLKAALNGLTGTARARQIERLRTITVQQGVSRTPNYIGPNFTGALSAEAAALARWQAASRWFYWPRFGFRDFRSWAGIQSNLWSLGRVTVGNGFRAYGNSLTVGARAIGAAAALDITGIPRAIQEYIRKIKNRTKAIDARLKMSPADDNIFPPSPATYMTLRKIRDMGTGEKIRLSANELFAATFGVDVIESWRTMSAIFNPTEVDPEIFEKRVLPTACQYRLHASTIWEVFEEMTLRHPGWIWGTRPYGTEFRDTMFFGTPSQRYWSRPASSAFVLRMNKLYEYIQRTGETEELIKKQIIEVYGTDIADKMLQEEVEVRQVGGQTVGSAPSQRSASTTVTINNGVDLELIKNKFRIALMDEWLKGMEQRFEPFRRYHLITSERDIISNNIICSEHSVQNGSQITYSKLSKLGKIKEQEKQVLQMKAHSLIPDHMVNTSVIDYNNCHSYKMALRYGQASIMYGLKEMYKGEISMLGNPRIRPWDVCILADSYNDISGPVEVESVIHMFSHETGFITEIKPNALVVGNEIATFPVLEALKLYAMAKMDLEENGNRSDGEEIESTTTTVEMREYFKRRYQEIFDENSQAFIDELNEAIDKERYLNASALNIQSVAEKPTLVSAPGGVSSSALAKSLIANSTADKEVGWTIGRGIAGAAAMAGLGIAAASGAAKVPQVFNITNRGAKLAAGMFGGSVGIGLGSTILPDKKSIVNSASTLIGSKLLFAKCMEAETVMVIPLLKGRRPIVSGMTLKHPSDVFESILGSVSNVVEDGIMGTRDMFDSWQDYKTASWQHVDQIVQDRNSFLEEYYAKSQIYFNWQEDYRVTR